MRFKRSVDMALPALAVLALGACAGVDGSVESMRRSAARTFEIRVLVKLVSPSSDAGAIATAAGSSAQAPARYVAATSERWHALAIACASPVDCLAAVDRLRAASAVFESVQIDALKRPAAS